jgi:hypothetical protein
VWKKVLAVLLVAPGAYLLVASIKWEEMGCDKLFGFTPGFVGQILIGMAAFSLISLATFLWGGKKPGLSAKGDIGCPHCGGALSADASFCRHCKEWLR